MTTNTVMTTEHKQAPIYDNGEVVFTVDEKLQGLLQYFFDSDICTFNSCQDNVGGTVWIEFLLYDWLEIIEAAYTQHRTNNHEFYYFAEENCDVRLHAQDDGCLDEDKDEWIEGEELIWNASVRFPGEFLEQFDDLIKDIIEKKSATAVS